MKYLKHTIALLCFSFMALFVVVMAAIKITTLFYKEENLEILYDKIGVKAYSSGLIINKGDTK